MVLELVALLMSLNANSADIVDGLAYLIRNEFKTHGVGLSNTCFISLRTDVAAHSIDVFMAFTAAYFAFFGISAIAFLTASRPVMSIDTCITSPKTHDGPCRAGPLPSSAAFRLGLGRARRGGCLASRLHAMRSLGQRADLRFAVAMLYPIGQGLTPARGNLAGWARQCSKVLDDSRPAVQAGRVEQRVPWVGLG